MTLIINCIPANAPTEHTFLVSVTKPSDSVQSHQQSLKKMYIILPDGSSADRLPVDYKKQDTKAPFFICCAKSREWGSCYQRKLFC